MHVEAGFSAVDDGFDLHFAGRLVLRHRSDAPVLTSARGKASVKMYRGNFQIDDAPEDALTPLDCVVSADGVTLSSDGVAVARIALEGNRLAVSLLRPGHDRITLRWHAEPGEAAWGGGEQMSYLALNGRRFPMWTSEPGVGRDKTTALTQAMDRDGMAGGDYYHTNYPQPTLLTSRWLAIHLDAACYSVIDCSDPTSHAFEVWKNEAAFELFAADGPLELVGQLSARFGRQPPLPDWAIGGAIVGLKDGACSFERLDDFIKAGAAVSGLWCEDWAGIRQTSFGRRLFWDWRRDNQRFPDLPQRIAALEARGIRFLAYANPYLCNDGILYEEALEGGHFCLKQDSDEVYLVDFGEFDCGVLDFTRPETRDWFAEKVLGREMLDIGISGWMADFGEYLPTDVRLADGSDPMEAHNRWPVLWAEVNAQAVESRGKTGDAVFFMRAGFSGVQAHCPLLWAGDQSVDFTRHDGIGTVITAALSAGLVGNAYSHADCGGYTSILGNIRTAELMERWCELAAFAPVMRSHEGNRPDDNLQYDSTPELLACFARWSRVHRHLASYVRHLCDEALEFGLPAQRPLFLHHANDAALYAVQDQYLYGADLLVAPVIEEGAIAREVILPGEGEWVHAFTGTAYAPGTHTIAAPIGTPPVFYRPDSAFADLFAGLRAL
ncbi:alpha-glucosidase [Novosphingobium sp.]|jgi:alpha-glucosidase|uniref:alpha-glucosidase n=1 Tax=Novosphingobium sp. TaxID=1874826 RepID=UPI0022C3E47E|nr:alpha-glucosidase [Novosphingobium sp.]MCZ8019517.1 alpha-glucosidase [Novosphingobium sp.]MCZ8050646.1 alpha-glucosidase [Novosphingobium sp.]MCZ8058992.1 alpha-glucosidase [Novosphingobium sp.]MCZ8232437.1 alpha-glucosidase [Novosphingobium sp.]MCZ8246007.1 alpha-glucosidase [Novosphingobium sp.]